MRRFLPLAILLFLGCCLVSGCGDGKTEPKKVKETPGRIPPKE